MQSKCSRRYLRYRSEGILASNFSPNGVLGCTSRGRILMSTPFLPFRSIARRRTIIRGRQKCEQHTSYSVNSYILRHRTGTLHKLHGALNTATRMGAHEIDIIFSSCTSTRIFRSYHFARKSRAHTSKSVWRCQKTFTRVLPAALL